MEHTGSFFALLNFISINRGNPRHNLTKILRFELHRRLIDCQAKREALPLSISKIDNYFEYKNQFSITIGHLSEYPLNESILETLLSFSLFIGDFLRWRIISWKTMLENGYPQKLLSRAEEELNADCFDSVDHLLRLLKNHGFEDFETSLMCARYFVVDQYTPFPGVGKVEEFPQRQHQVALPTQHIFSDFYRDALAISSRIPSQFELLELRNAFVVYYRGKVIKDGADVNHSFHIFSEDGFCIDPSRSLFVQPYTTRENSSYGNISKLNFFTEMSIRVKEPCLFIGGEPEYSDWFSRHLPKAIAVEGNPGYSNISFFTVALKPFMKESLDLLFPNTKVLEARPPTFELSCKVYHFERLLVTHMPSIDSRLGFLRDKFAALSLSPEIKETPLSLVYLRPSSHPRGMGRAINENEIFELVTRLGFSAIDPAQFSLKAKSKILGSSQIVISTIGSTSINFSMFCPEHCVHVQLIPKGFHLANRPDEDSARWTLPHLDKVFHVEGEHSLNPLNISLISLFNVPCHFDIIKLEALLLDLLKHLHTQRVKN
jgi:hypothetical protein